MLNDTLKLRLDAMASNLNQIKEARKEQLDELAVLAKKEIDGHKVLRLNFICTHNSRRSHISQLLAWAAATYVQLKDVEFYSGGVEVTSFNPRAIEAMRRAGFIISHGNGDNPHYEVKLDEQGSSSICFSKTYDDASNPKRDFIAVMVCTDAEQNCPFVAGASARVSLSYIDPKEADDTPNEKETYDQRVEEIGREMLYLMQRIKTFQS
jgi:arsenate reductase